MNGNTDSFALADWLEKTPADWWCDCEPEVMSIARRLYDSPGRFYHTWTHIADCLDRCLAARLESPRTVFLALLFHDAIYVAGRQDNEAQSALVANEVLTEHSRLSKEERERVRDMILLTAKHNVSDLALVEDEKKIIDIDLSILAAPWPQYQTYMEGVRKEWCPVVVSESRFRIGRLAFLHSIVSQPFIFASEDFRQRLDLRARTNLEQEMRLLDEEQGWVERIEAKLHRALGARTARLRGRGRRP